MVKTRPLRPDVRRRYYAAALPRHPGPFVCPHRGSQLTAGDLVFDFASDTWAWSDDVYRIHGFAPGDVVPSTRLLLAHVHPDDRGRFATMLDGVGADGQPIMSHHRLVDAKAGVRYVVLALRGRFTVQDTGQDELPSTPVGLSGYLIDLTAVRE